MEITIDKEELLEMIETLVSQELWKTQEDLREVKYNAGRRFVEEETGLKKEIRLAIRKALPKQQILIGSFVTS